MSQMIAFVGLGLLAYLYVKSESEKYETTPQSQSVPITHGLTQQMIQLTQPALVQKLGGKCLVYPIETSYIRQDGDTFHCRFMFTVIQSNQYPYGISVSSDIRDGAVVSIELENLNTVDRMDAFNQFETGAQLKEQPLPTLSQLQSAFALA
jgi:hypothetical protein